MLRALRERCADRTNAEVRSVIHSDGDSNDNDDDYGVDGVERRSRKF